MRLLAAIFALLLSGPAYAAGTFTSLPTANEPLGGTTEWAPLDQGSGCNSTGTCTTVKAPPIRFGQPVQTTCSTVVSPFLYQQCIDTSVTPRVLKIWLGSAWVPLENYDTSGQAASPVPSGATTLYVNPSTGNDAGPCSSTSPCLTYQHTIDVGAQLLKTAFSPITIQGQANTTENVELPTFLGASWGNTAQAGMILDCGGNSIAPASGVGLLAVSTSTPYFVQNCRFTVPVGGTAIEVDQGANISFGVGIVINLATASPSSTAVLANDYAQAVFYNPVTISGTATTMFTASDGGHIHYEPSSLILSATPSFPGPGGGLVWLQRGGSVTFPVAMTFTGSVVSANQVNSIDGDIRNVFQAPLGVSWPAGSTEGPIAGVIANPGSVIVPSPVTGPGFIISHTPYQQGVSNMSDDFDISVSTDQTLAFLTVRKNTTSTGIVFGNGATTTAFIGRNLNLTSDYATMSLNAESGGTDYNLASGTVDRNLYLNVPANKSFIFSTSIGAVPVLQLNSTGATFTGTNPEIVTPSVSAPATPAQNLNIIAGSATGTGGASNGGNLILEAGTSTNGTPGTIQLLSPATVTTINGLTLTPSAATLTIITGKTFTVNNSLTLAGTDATTMTFPAASTTVAGLGTQETFTARQTFVSPISAVFGAPAVTSGNIFLDGSTSGNTQMTVDATGNFQIPSGIPNASGNQILCYNTGTGAVTYEVSVATCVPSALRLKNPIEFLDPETALDRLALLRPAVYTYKDTDTFGVDPFVGLYADDVCKFDERLCVRNAEGQVQNYDKIGLTAYLVAINKELARKVSALEHRK